MIIVKKSVSDGHWKMLRDPTVGWLISRWTRVFRATVTIQVHSAGSLHKLRRVSEPGLGSAREQYSDSEVAANPLENVVMAMAMFGVKRFGIHRKSLLVFSLVMTGIAACYT